MPPKPLMDLEKLKAELEKIERRREKTRAQRNTEEYKEYARTYARDRWRRKTAEKLGISVEEYIKQRSFLVKEDLPKWVPTPPSERKRPEKKSNVVKEDGVFKAVGDDVPLRRRGRPKKVIPQNAEEAAKLAAEALERAKVRQEKAEKAAARAAAKAEKLAAAAAATAVATAE